MKNFAVRFPLMVRAGVALVLMGVVRLGIAFGWLPVEWNLDDGSVEQVIDAVIFAVTWFTSQRKVTPVAAPKDDRGRRLVPSDHPYAV